jgi:hypothetical protein
LYTANQHCNQGKLVMTRFQRIIACLTVTVAAALLFLGGNPRGVVAKPPGGGGGGGTPPLPAVRYRIKFVALPGNAASGPLINDMNNWGQVVGWYSPDGQNRTAFLYDPVVDANQALDVNTIVAAGIPDGWRVASLVGINDWMVAVGYIAQIGSDPMQVRPVAIDLAAANPVVDLLPDVGVDYSYGKHINENGDIMGVYKTADGDSLAWGFNPGLYGDPQQRVWRDGSPLDLCDETPLPLPLSGNAQFFIMNNPVGDRPAQIFGPDTQKLSDAVPFRYTLGDAAPERFPALDLVWWPGALNDSGTFCGLLNASGTDAPFRYNTALDQLPALSQQTQDMNESGDLIFYDVLYRDDWQQYGYVKIDDLVVGTAADLQLWFATPKKGRLSQRDVGMYLMNDRAGASNSGQIAGLLNITGVTHSFYVLTPEPAPAP